jgi:hypothetical protein
MKKSLLLISLLVFIFACNRPTDKKAELEKLKKQHDDNNKYNKLKTLKKVADKVNYQIIEVNP